MGLFDALDPMSGMPMNPEMGGGSPYSQYRGPYDFNPLFELLKGNGGKLPSWLAGPNVAAAGQGAGPQMGDPAGTGMIPQGGPPISGPMPYNRASQDMPGFGPDLAPPPSPFDTARPGGPSYGPGDGSALPPNATPTTNIPPQGGPPQGPPVSGPAPPSFLDKLMGGISSNSNTLMALGAGLAGAPSWGTGISRALQGAMPASQLDQKQIAITQATSALVRDGKLSPDMAALVANNPKALEQILPQLLGAKQAKFTQIGESATGGKSYGFVNEVDKKVYDQNGKQITGASGGITVPNDQATGLPLQGQPLLDHMVKTGQLTPSEAAAVKGIYKGDENAAGRNLQKLLPVTSLVYPDFTQQDYQTKLATRKEYTSGPGGREIKAVNTAIYHADKLLDISDKLGGSNFAPGYLNPLIQGTKRQYDAEYQQARRDWDATAETLATETSKALNGGTPHVADKEHWRALLSGDAAPVERQAAIKSVMQILEGRTHAAAQNYSQGMKSARDPLDFIDPDNRAKFERLTGRGTPAPSAAAAPAAPASGGEGWVDLGGGVRIREKR